jgi:autotransporter-associated beta strand protein
LLGGISTTTAVPLSLNGTGISGATNGALESVSGNNTYSGLLYIAGSNISVGSDTPGNTLTLSNTGTILCSSVGGNLSLTGTGNIVVDSVIGTNTGGLTKSGPGMATLMNASTYSGTTSITAGILNIENNSSLGSGVGTSTSGVGVQSGAALQLQGNITTTTAVRLTLNGAGVNTNGALENVSGNNTYTGPITMAAGAWIGSDAGNLVLSNTSNITTTGNNSLTFTGAGNISVAGGLSINGGSVTKNGSGALTLSGSSNYTGTTTVNAGAVIVTGSLSGSYAAIVTNATLEVDGSFNNNAVEVAVTNGALQGNGVTGGPVVLTSGTLSPGLNTTLGTPATGTLTANNNVSLDSNSVFAIRLGLAASGTDSDELIMGGGGVLSLSGSLELTLGGNIDNAPLNSIYDIINGNGNSITGTFNGIAEDGVISVNGDSFEVLYNSDAAGDGGAGDYVALDLIAVPEPGTWAILASGLGMLVCMQRVQRRSRKAKA